MKKFKLVNIRTSGPYQYQYQYYVSTYNWGDRDNTLVSEIRRFLIDHTGSSGNGPGDLWWHSEYTDRIYMREKDMTFFLIKFGHLMENQETE